MDRPLAIILTLLLAATIGCAAASPAAAPATPTLPTSAQAGGTSIVAIAPPAQQCCPKQTLPQFLGLVGACDLVKTICNRIRNRLGSIWPGLEAKPEVLAISDPKNLESSNPAVAAAAGVKAEEDAAAQKAKAIAYLASIGCAGCYPGIEEALLAALDDCTEMVRFETAKALRSTALYPCKNCCRSACCGPKIREKLMKIAYETDEQGCFLESSDRVRRMARLALEHCSCVPEKPTQQQTLPEEGPGPEDMPPPGGAAVAATTSIIRPSPNLRSSFAPEAYQSGQSNLASGINPEARAGASRSVSYDEALSAYASRNNQTPPSAIEVAWESWTARPSDFASREAALTALTLARAEAMSSQPGRYVPPQFAHASYDWTDPARINSPGVARALATTPAGGVSGLIEDRNGWHLVRVTDRRPAPLPSPAPASAIQSVIRQPASTQTASSPPASHAPIGSGIQAKPTGQAPSVMTFRLPDCNCK